ncbi:GNAT family N-acetyltransferase [Brachybacterium hainanense]|uniref:GNAT family N-acetyltransferase n=1 Tax=Brachybacterium hainanense TaxID=1541174 RepID=A0ABV6R8R9_9MICO
MSIPHSADRREIRLAGPDDVAALHGIEAAADALFEDLFGPAPFGEDSAADGAERMAEPGFVLVAAEEPGGPAIGFAHVLAPLPGLPADAHLEQLAVDPAHLRRGHGRALVEAAVAEAAARSAVRMTLRTYLDVPWNAPFYAACGFIAIDPIDAAIHRQMIRTEEEIGLFAHGPRTLMARDIDPPR